jgi:hypothetical protein
MDLMHIEANSLLVISIVKIARARKNIELSLGRMGNE